MVRKFRCLASFAEMNAIKYTVLQIGMLAGSILCREIHIHCHNNRHWIPVAIIESM